MSATRSVTAQGLRIELALSSQVLAVWAPAETAHGIRGPEEEAPLRATLRGLSPTTVVSASVLAQKAKMFDDGLYAAVEVAAQEGAGRFGGKAALLEPLVIPERMPEAAHLALDEKYRTLLLELFKGLLTLTRETHIKQLEIPVVATAARHPQPRPREETFIDIAPALTAEPLATFYLRRALVYRFNRDVLSEAFGPSGVERRDCTSDTCASSAASSTEASPAPLASVPAVAVCSEASRRRGQGSDDSPCATALHIGEWRRLCGFRLPHFCSCFSFGIG